MVVLRMFYMSKGTQLRQLIAKGCVAMPGVPNAAMARQVERAGFEAVYVSGAGMANATAGVPDIGLLTLVEGGAARRLRRERQLKFLPSSMPTLDLVAVKMSAARFANLKRAGLAGCHIEDQEFPKRCGHLAGKSLVYSGSMVTTIKTRGGSSGATRIFC